MTYEEAVEYIYRYSNTYSRMEMVLEFVPPWFVTERVLSFQDGVRLVGQFWSDCDNIREHLPRLRKVLGINGPLREMMTDAENHEYDSLPDIVTCYRGCDVSVLTGASWTLDWQIANSFPFLPRYRAPSPVVVTARAKKSRILALKHDRDEREIITFAPRRISVSPANKEEADQFFANRRKADLESLEALAGAVGA